MKQQKQIVKSVYVYNKQIGKSNKVGIMAGASTPEESIQKILEKVEKIIEI